MMPTAADEKRVEKVATRALSYTVRADDGSELFSSAARGQKIKLTEAQVTRFEKRGSIADPGSPEAEAAQRPQPVGLGSGDYMLLEEPGDAALALRASGMLAPGGSVANADADGLDGLDDVQLRVIASTLGINPLDKSRQHLIAEIEAGTGALAAAAAAVPTTVATDATDGARDLAAEERVDLSTVTGSGSGGRITKDDVQAVVDARA